MISARRYRGRNTCRRRKARGEPRPADQQLVVVQNELVHAHRRGLSSSPPETGHLISGDGAQHGQRLGVVPGVVDQLHIGILGGIRLFGQAHVRQQRRPAHHGVGAQRHQHIGGRGLGPQLAHDGPKEERQGDGARAVGHDHQHALAGNRQRVASQINLYKK